MKKSSKAATDAALASGSWKVSGKDVGTQSTKGAKDARRGADAKKPAIDKPSAPAKKPAKQRAAPPPVRSSDDYLADIDLPSSDSSDSDAGPSARRPAAEVIAALNAGPSAKEQKKALDRERKQLEKAVAAKAAALRDDDNVFDVSHEAQGAEQGDGVVSATDIKVHNLTVRVKGKALLEGADLVVASKRRYGLVGPNGKGKSTLLRLIARRQIPVPSGLDVLLVEQEVVGTDQSALASVVAADVELVRLRAEEIALNDHLGRLEIKAQGGDDESREASATAAREDETEMHAEVSAQVAELSADDAADRLAEVYDRMRDLGAASAEARASRILHGLGFTEAMQRRATRLFSGGWRMRISLARALYIQPTVLLLDEPTNHLDLRAVLWLEEYLTRWKKTLVVVSHDRDFLNSVTTDIIHLHDERLHPYRGNFAQFEEMYEQRRREANKEFDKYAKQVKAAKRQGGQKSADRVTKEAQKTAARKASRGSKGAQAEDSGTASASAPRQWNDYSVHFEFPTPTELPPPLLQLIDASFAYPGRDDFAMRDLDVGIDMGSRIAIVGPNGAGKTTLMNLLAGDLEVAQGDQRKSPKLRVGRYAQHFVDALSFDENAVEYLLRRFPQAGLKPEEIRARLGRFGLSGHHHLQPIAKLSGGQKARVVFAAIAMSQPHILLLDEPTNHLDMQSIDALADALQAYEGGVVVISHDSRLLSTISDDAERAEVWVVEDGRVRRYDGDFEDYKNDLIREITADLDDE
ncbi:hypothetical protein H632_c403p0 [Helicosporidium sp. ATCC 50920]|nr:hypothetical protein H632_c403p0 [Helicosporidium sp. ATCC 50920]|eukprot:KDD75994.1 hypothetical protein H632_c403p0 [Helicosporidium sp. ATCC 50920]